VGGPWVKGHALVALEWRGNYSAYTGVQRVLSTGGCYGRTIPPLKTWKDNERSSAFGRYRKMLQEELATQARARAEATDEPRQQRPLGQRQQLTTARSALALENRQDKRKVRVDSKTRRLCLPSALSSIMSYMRVHALLQQCMRECQSRSA
jgi:hypothetical protein